MAQEEVRTMSDEVKTKLKEAFMAFVGGAIGGVISFLLYAAIFKVLS
jgi:hypothetical protein